MRRRPVLAFTQGDPAGIGPEILVKLLAGFDQERYVPLLFAERSAVEAIVSRLGLDTPALTYFERTPGPAALAELGDGVAVVDPQSKRRDIRFGEPGPLDAAGALAAIDAAVDAVLDGLAAAVVTAPVGKSVIARWVASDFRGHSDYLARRCGLEQYGRDYLMTFLGPDLRVALLSTHVPLREALERLRTEAVVEALSCLQRNLGGGAGRIALAGLNPHAGEGGVLGREDLEILVPAVAQARDLGIDVVGPESPDTVFARARQGEFDWVLALYHDQGLIAVKSAAFGEATNWTLGLPFLRTSVDHGTAYSIAGRGVADARPLEQVVELTLQLLEEGYGSSESLRREA